MAEREPESRVTDPKQPKQAEARKSESKLGFVDSLMGLFRGKPEAPPSAAAQEPAGFESLRSSFEQAVQDLEKKASELALQRPSASGEGVRARTADERAADEARRMAAAHEAIRKDIDGAHARLRSGLENEDLDALSRYISDLALQIETGKGSHELLPRARFAIVEKLRLEAGELAVARLVDLLQQAKQPWPDPIPYRPGASPEEIERSRRRRLAETRENFLAQSLERTAERMLGIVKTWGPDYPDPGSPLWEETVLEGVAAGIRGSLVKECVECMQEHREEVLARSEASIGKELEALHKALKGGVNSLEQANFAVASSLRTLDEVIPPMVWEYIQSQLPHARGEWGS